jgi:hypothetical protein
MKRVSGFLLPLLLALLVIPAVAAFDLESDNGMSVPNLETKTIGQEEVTAEQRGEILIAIAVNPRPVRRPVYTELLMAAITAQYESPVEAGGIPVSPGGL